MPLAQVFQIVIAVLLAILGALSMLVFRRVMENGETLVRVATKQQGVIETLADIQKKGYVTKAEHEALVIRVSTQETSLVKIETKLDMLLQELRHYKTLDTGHAQG